MHSTELKHVASDFSFIPENREYNIAPLPRIQKEYGEDAHNIAPLPRMEREYGEMDDILNEYGDNGIEKSENVFDFEVEKDTLAVPPLEFGKDVSQPTDILKEHRAPPSTIVTENTTLVGSENRPHNAYAPKFDEIITAQNIQEERKIGKLKTPQNSPVKDLGPIQSKGAFPVEMVAEAGRFELQTSAWMRSKQFKKIPNPEFSRDYSGVFEEEDSDFEDDDYFAPAPTSHVAISSYSSKQSDEMTFQNGDLIGIEKQYSDGWYILISKFRARGQNISQNRARGIFPLALVTAITSGPTQAIRRGKKAVFRALEANNFIVGDLKLLPRTVSSRKSRLSRQDTRRSMRSSLRSSIHSVSSAESK